MFAFSVLTPYYEEEVIYSLKDLNTTNEDGITTLFYLQKVFPGLFPSRNSSSCHVEGFESNITNSHGWLDSLVCFLLYEDYILEFNSNCFAVLTFGRWLQMIGSISKNGSRVQKRLTSNS